MKKLGDFTKPLFSYKKYNQITNEFKQLTMQKIKIKIKGLSTKETKYYILFDLQLQHHSLIVVIKIAIFKICFRKSPLITPTIKKFEENHECFN